MKILVVDDKEENRYLLETLLTGNGFATHTATNGKEALELLRSEEVDMIISNVLMPVMDGFQLCRECKRDKELKDIPFVFYTATYTDKRDKEFALNLGADRYIRKPIEPDEFMKIIQSVITNAGEGKLKTKKRVLEEKETFNLYSERLVNKLEKKMLDLKRESTERKQAEKQIRKSLQEKELLIREVHHRVKNNLQIISSLLDMVNLRIRDEDANNSIIGIQSKIHAMSIIHSQLYASDAFHQINLRSYIPELVSYLFALYPASRAITAVIGENAIYLGIDQAVPYAIILNELVSNALKHAFKKREKGIINISTERLADNTILTKIRDDGIGMPSAINIADVNSMGLKLVRNIIQQQLKGKMQVKRNGGTEFIIEFRPEQEGEK